MTHGKRYRRSKELVKPGSRYKIEEAVDLLKKFSACKFDETVEITVNLSVDPKKTDQQIRGTAILPHGTGKVKKVFAIVKGEKAKEAETNGADRVGYDDIITDITKGKIEFDVLVTTPDSMRDLGKIGKILGPKGLMPSPKSGTVTMDIGEAIKNIKGGQIEFKIDSYGIIHLGVGKISFTEDKLVENLNVFINALKKLRPASVKGAFINSISLTTTMGPGIKLDPAIYL